MGDDWKKKLKEMGACESDPTPTSGQESKKASRVVGQPDVSDIEQHWLANEAKIDQQPEGPDQTAPAARPGPIVERVTIPVGIQMQGPRPQTAIQKHIAPDAYGDDAWSVVPNILARPPARGGRTPQGYSPPPRSAEQKPDRAPSTEYRPDPQYGRRLLLPMDAECGRECQHPEYAEQQSILQIHVGLDFGTAFTKAVLRVGDELLAVDWREALGERLPTYMLPSVVHRRADGSMGWFGDRESELCANLKLPLLDHHHNDQDECRAVAFLALALRFARAYLYRHAEYGPRCASRKLAWEFNIGCPTTPHQDPQVVELFRRVAMAAWFFAGHNEITEDAIRSWLATHELAAIPDGLERSPEVQPEFVAQIASYLRSRQCRDGLHALIDVGAATLDVATFNVVTLGRDGEAPRIPIFGSAVERLGTHFLLQARYERLGIELAWDEAAPVESCADFARRHARERSEIAGADQGIAHRVAASGMAIFRAFRAAAADQEIAHRVAAVIRRVLAVTRSNHGDPRSAAWHEGLPLFLTGGGALVEAYRQAVAGINRVNTFDPTRRLPLLGGLQAVAGFNRVNTDPLFYELPLTIRRLAVPEDVYRRLTVAIGLTEDAENLALIVPSRDIEPVAPNHPPPPWHNGGAHGDGEPG